MDPPLANARSEEGDQKVKVWSCFCVVSEVFGGDETRRPKATTP